MIDTETMIDIVAIVENIRKTPIDQTLDKDIIINPEVRIDLDLIIIIKEEHHLDLHIDLHTEITQITDIILAQDTDLVLNHKETPFKRYNYPYRSPSRPRDFRSRSRTPSRKTTKQNKSSRR